MNKKATIAILLASSLALSGCIVRATGEKVGMFTKLAQQGFWCPTWEGSIQRGGFNAGSGVTGSAFEFTVEDPEILKQVRDAMEKQLEVKITYKQEMITFCRSESDDHFLTSVTVIGKGSAAPIIEQDTSAKPVTSTPAVTGPAMTKAEALNEVIRQNQQIIDILKDMK